MDVLTLSCPTCDAQLRVPVEYLGQKVQCNFCDAAFVSEPPSPTVVTLPGGPTAPSPALVSENLRLWAELETHSREYQRALAHIRALEAKSGRRKREIANLERELASLRDRLIELEQVRLERDQHHEALNTLQGQLGQVAGLRKELEAARRDRDLAVDAANQHEATIATLVHDQHERHSIAEARLQDAASRLLATESEAEALRSQIEELQRESCRHRESLHSELAEQRQSVEAIQLDRDRLQTELDLLTMERARLLAAESQAKALRREIDEIQHHSGQKHEALLAELASHRESVEAIQLDRDRLRTELDLLTMERARLLAAESQAKALRKEIDEIQHHAGQKHEALLAEVGEHRESALASRIDRDRLQAELNAVSAERDRLAAAEEEAASLRNQIEALQEQAGPKHAALLAELAEHRQSVEAIRIDRDRLQTERNALAAERDRLAAWELEAEDLRREVEYLQVHVSQGRESLLAELAESRVSAEANQLEFDRLRKDLEIVIAERDRLAEERAKLEETSRANEERLRSEALVLRAQLEESNRMQAELAGQLASCRSSVLELNEALDSNGRELDQRLTAFREEFESTRTDLVRRLTEAEEKRLKLEHELFETERQRLAADSRSRFLQSALEKTSLISNGRTDEEIDEIEDARRQIESLKRRLAEAHAKADQAESTLVGMGILVAY